MILYELDVSRSDFFQGTIIVLVLSHSICTSVDTKMILNRHFVTLDRVSKNITLEGEKLNQVATTRMELSGTKMKKADFEECESSLEAEGWLVLLFLVIYKAMYWEN